MASNRILLKETNDRTSESGGQDQTADPIIHYLQITAE